MKWSDVHSGTLQIKWWCHWHGYWNACHMFHVTMTSIYSPVLWLPLPRLPVSQCYSVMAGSCPSLRSSTGTKQPSSVTRGSCYRYTLTSLIPTRTGGFISRHGNTVAWCGHFRMFTLAQWRQSVDRCVWVWGIRDVHKDIWLGFQVCKMSDVTAYLGASLKEYHHVKLNKWSTHSNSANDLQACC